MDTKPEPVSKFQHLENEAAVIAHVAADLPNAIWKGVREDFQASPVKRTVETLATAAVTAALYIGTRRAPIITRDVSVAGGTVGGVAAAVPSWKEAEKIYDGTKALLADGWNAGDEASRSKLGHEYASAIGKNVAPLADVSVGAAFGLATGHGILSKAGPNAWLSANLTEKAEYNWRRHAFLSEKSLLSKSGSFTSPNQFMNTDGTANLIHVSEAVDAGPRTALNKALRTVDPHVEEARVINLGENRVSAPMRGSLHSVEFGFNPQNITYHTHPEYVGAKPSVSDVTRFNGVQMLRSGDDIAVYLGETGKYRGVAEDASIDTIFEQRGTPSLKALVVNTREKTARIIEGTAVRTPQAADGAAFANNWQWSPSIPTYVDYDASARLLARTHVNDPVAFGAQLKHLTEASTNPQVDILQEIMDMHKLSGAAR